LAYELLMAKERASAVFTDPPYNVKIDGNVCGSGAVKHREFAMASDEMTREEFARFLAGAFDLARAYASPGAIIYACMDWRHMAEMLAAGDSANFELLNLCVWVKTNGGMGSLYRSRHELVFVFRNGGEAHRDNVQLGRFGRNRTNVWNYPGANIFKRNGRKSDLDLHPTVKPIAMVADAILDSTDLDDLILDPFLGSGTTLLAAERACRRCHGVELDPLYVDTVIAPPGPASSMSPSSSTHTPGGSSAGGPAGRRMRTSSWTPSNNSRRLLNQSTHSRVANSTASRLRHGPRRWTTSALQRPLIVSARALS
jgi:DNA modification methylase